MEEGHAPRARPASPLPAPRAAGRPEGWVPMRSTAARAAALALALAALGCAPLMHPLDPTRGFEEVQERFAAYLRWGRISEASQLVAAERREGFLEAARGLERVRLTGYEVLSVEMGEAQRSATARVRFTGHPVALPVERSVELVERWSRQEDSSDWRVEVELARLTEGLHGAAP